MQAKYEGRMSPNQAPHKFPLSLTCIAQSLRGK